MTTPYTFDPFRRSPSGERVLPLGATTSDVVNRSVVPGSSMRDALDRIYARRIEYLDTEDGPAGLWNFDDTLAAVVGPDLVLDAGTYTFTDIAPGCRGIDIPLNTRLSAPVTSSLVFTGDMSLEVILQLNTNPTNLWIAGVGGADTGAAANNVTGALILPSTTAPRPVRVFWESAGGIDRGFTTPTTAGSLSVPPIHNIISLGWSRSGTSATVYMNGRVFAGPTSGVAAPTGGTNGQLSIGGRIGALSTDQFLLSSVAVYGRARPAAEWLASYNRSLGNGLGFIT